MFLLLHRFFIRLFFVLFFVCFVLSVFFLLLFLLLRLYSFFSLLSSFVSCQSYLFMFLVKSIDNVH